MQHHIQIESKFKYYLYSLDITDKIKQAIALTNKFLLAACLAH